LALTVALAAPADGPPEKLVDRLWALTELVLDNHIDPPSRQQMLLGAARAAARAGGRLAPDDLSRRASALTTKEQFAELLKEVWPKDAPGDKLEAALIEAVARQAQAEVAVRLDPKDRENAGQNAGNRHVGTRHQIRKADHYIQIVTPMRNGPAHKAGAKPNDLIVAVDGKDTKGVRLEQVVEWLRGPEGSKVTMTVRQPDSNQTRDLP